MDFNIACALYFSALASPKFTYLFDFEKWKLSEEY